MLEIIAELLCWHFLSMFCRCSDPLVQITKNQSSKFDRSIRLSLHFYSSVSFVNDLLFAYTKGLVFCHNTQITMECRMSIITTLFSAFRVLSIKLPVMTEK